MRKSYMVFRIIIKGKWPNIIERKIEMGKKKKRVTARSCIPLILSFHFLSRAFTVPTVYREKKKKKIMRVLVQKKVGKKKYVYSIEKNRVDTNHICNFRGKKKKEKKNIMKNCQNCFRYFEKVSYYIIACIIMRK